MKETLELWHLVVGLIGVAIAVIIYVANFSGKSATEKTQVEWEITAIKLRLDAKKARLDKLELRIERLEVQRELNNKNLQDLIHTIDKLNINIVNLEKRLDFAEKHHN